MNNKIQLITRKTVDGQSTDAPYSILHTGNKALITPADIGAIPFDTSRTTIKENSDLNNEAYLTVGCYRCVSNSSAQTLINSPTTVAFTLDVLPSTGVNKLIVPGTWTYIEQRIHDMNGNEYKRFINSNSNNNDIFYGNWIATINTNNIKDAAVATTSANGLMSASDKSKLNKLTTESCKIVTGTYSGTGMYGIDNPNSLTFNFKPKIIIITPASINTGVFSGSNANFSRLHQTDMLLWHQGMKEANIWDLLNGTDVYRNYDLTNNTFSWYLIPNNNSNTPTGAKEQLNVNKTTYYYTAIG